MLPASEPTSFSLVRDMFPIGPTTESAKLLRATLEDPHLRTFTIASLKSQPTAIRQLLERAAGVGCEVEYGVSIMRALGDQRLLSAAAHREGALQTCLTVIAANRDARLTSAARLLAVAPCGRADAHARTSKIAALFRALDQPASEHALATLSALYGRLEVLNGDILYHVDGLADAIDLDVDALEALSRAIGAASRSDARLEQLCSIACAAAVALASVGIGEHRGIIDAKLIDKLVAKLPHARAAEALWHICSTQLGQEHVVKAVGALYSCLEAEDSEARRFSARALGLLGAFAAARDGGLAPLLHSKSAGVELLVGEAVNQSRSAARAASRHGVIALIERLLLEPADSERWSGTLLCIVGMARHGDVDDCRKLVECGCMKQAVEQLARRPAEAWHCIASLVASTDDARTEAARLDIAGRLPSGLEAGGLAAFRACDAIVALCDTTSGAEAVGAALTPQAFLSLLMPTDPDVDSERRLACQASTALGRLIELQPVAAKRPFRRTAATVALDAAIALVQLPKHESVSSVKSSLLPELALSERGLEVAAEAVEAVVTGGATRRLAAKLLSQGLLEQCFESLDGDETLAHRLTRALTVEGSAEERVALLHLLTVGVRAPQLPKMIKAGAVKLLVPLLLDAEPTVVEFAARALIKVSGHPEAGRQVQEAGGITLLLAAARTGHVGVAPAALEALRSLFHKGAAEAELAGAMIDGGVLGLIDAALDADPECELEHGLRASQLLGCVAAVPAGRDAALDRCRRCSVHAIVGVLMHETGRAAAADAAVVQRVEGWLEGGGARHVELAGALRALLLLATGNDMAKQAVFPLLPRVAALMSSERTPPEALSLAASIVAALAAGGTAALGALLQHGVFGAVLPMMRRAVCTNPLNTLTKARELLTVALGDRKTSQLASAIIRETVAGLPATVDPFDAHEARVAMQTIAFTKESVCVLLLEAGILERLCPFALQQDEWATLRRCSWMAAYRIKQLIKSIDGMAVARKLGMLELVLAQLERCGGEEAGDYISLLARWSSAQDLRCQEELLAAGGLEAIDRWINPSLSLYGEAVYCVQILMSRLMSVEGTEHDAIIAKHSVSFRILEVLKQGRIKSNPHAKQRTLYLLARVASLPAGREAVRQLIGDLGGEVMEARDAATQLKVVISVLGSGAFVAAEEGAAAAFISLLEDKAKAATHVHVLQSLFSLARIHPEKVAPAARECSRRVGIAIDVKDTDVFAKESLVTFSGNAPRILSAIAGVSTKARATIASTVQRIFEDDDESHQVTVLRTITSMCCRKAGAAAAFAAGVVKQLEAALVGACTGTSARRQIRIATLQALTVVAQLCEGARAAMQDGPIISSAAQLLAAGVSDTRETPVTNTALCLLLALSEAEALRLSIQASAPLGPLEHVCHNSAKEQRTLALMLLSNVYAEALDIDDSHTSISDVDGRKRRVRELLGKYAFAREVVIALQLNLASFRSAECSIELLRRSLVAVRSLALDEKLAEAMLEASVAPALVSALRTMRGVSDCATAADLSIAAEAVQKLSYRAAFRPRLIEAGLKVALQETLKIAEAVESPEEGDLKLAHVAKASLDALDGKLDSPSTSVVVGRRDAEMSGDALAAMPRFHAFLSHKRSDAQDFARSIFALLVGKGLDCFLDVEALEEISDLPLIVAGCDALIFVLTDGVLDSRWCLQELAAAVDAGVSVILVTKEGARWPDEDGRMVCTFPPAHLISRIEPASARKAFMTKAIAHSNEYYAAFAQSLLKRVLTAVEASALNPAECALERRKRLQDVRQRMLDEPEPETRRAPLVKDHAQLSSAAAAPGERASFRSPPPVSPAQRLPVPAQDAVAASVFDAAAALKEVANRQADALSRQSEAMERQAIAMSEAITKQSEAMSAALVEALRVQAEALRIQMEAHHQHLKETLAQQAESHSYHLALHSQLCNCSSDESSEAGANSTRLLQGIRRRKDKP